MKGLCVHSLMLGVLVLSACNLPGPASEDEIQSIPPLASTAGVMPLELAGVQPQPGDTLPWVDGGLLVYIPAGDFIMGGMGQDNPEHTINLGRFWIYRTEVTNRMYARCMAMGKCSPPPTDPSLADVTDPKLADRPVTGLKWEQADTYCRFVGGHLPTEAQWEKAARGPDGNPYPWGEAQPTCDLLNFDECIGETSDVIDYPQGRSFYDVLDMAGNVFEWVSDWYQENYYNESPLQDPAGPVTGKYRSVRGSSFESGSDEIASALRYFLNPEGHRPDLGFRCAVANPYEYAPPCQVLAYISSSPSGEPESTSPGTTGCFGSWPEIDTVSWCAAGQRHVNFNFSPPRPEVVMTYSGSADCSEYDLDTVTCVGGGGDTAQVTVCQTCVPEPEVWAEPARCDPPYIFYDITGMCIMTSHTLPGTACTSGFVLDPDLLCCNLEAGTPASFPACPAGSDYDFTFGEVCVFENEAGEPRTGCEEQAYTFSPCGGPGDDDDDGCRLSGASCAPNGFDAVRCCCTNQNGACIPP